MSQWLVALVGRPNVGKSTLFNRIIGHRQAIVDETPGVTRDRHYARADWAGREFTLVDTGGFVPASDDAIEAAIREQAVIAIEEADLVLFVVDATTGPHPADVEIAQILRRARKKVALVVNKVDSDRRDPDVAEFYALGLGEPIGVSALVGRKVGDLLDSITRNAPAAEENSQDTRLKVAVIGKPNVGKSSFVNALLREKRHIVTELPGTTRDPIDAILKYHGEEILLVDTAGLRRRSKIKESVEFFSTIRTLKSIERCDVAVIMLDATQGLEHQDLRIVETTVEHRRGALIAVNKWDLIEKDSRTADAYHRMLKEKLRLYDFIPVLFISSLSGQRVFKVIDLAQGINAEQNRRIPTNQLNAMIGEEIKRKPPKSRSGKEIKINYITQVRVRPPVIAFFCNEPKLVDESYKRFLENRLREHFKFTGVPVLLSFKKK